MIKFRALCFSAILGIVITLTGTLPAWAAPSAANSSKGISLTTSPVSTDLVGKPGSSVSTTLQVMNNSNVPLNISLQLDTFKASGTGGQAQIVPPSKSDDFIKWVSFSRNSFLAQPNVWNQVQMTINIPDYAGLGYYYAVLFKPSIPNQTSKLSETLKSSNAILVLLNAQSSNEHPKITVSSFTTTKSIYEYLPVTFNVNVHNNGNIYLPPNGDVYVSRTTNFGKLLDVLPINTDLGNVLPGTNRIYSATWKDGSPLFVPKTIGGQPVTTSSGQTVYQLKYNFGNGKFRFGKYYAKLVLVYNNGVQDVPITAIVSFWVIPWKIMLVVLLFIAIIVGLIVFIFRLKRKVNQKTKWRA